MPVEQAAVDVGIQGLLKTFFIFYEPESSFRGDYNFHSFVVCPIQFAVVQVIPEDLFCKRMLLF